MSYQILQYPKRKNNTHNTFLILKMKAHFEKKYILKMKGHSETHFWQHFDNENMFFRSKKVFNPFKKLQLAKSIYKEMFKNVGSKFNSLTLCFSSVEVDSFPS